MGANPAHTSTFTPCGPVARTSGFFYNGRRVSQHKVEQRRLTHRGRVFHFVSYEAVPANERRGELAVPPMWHLMNEGKRRPVMPHVAGQDPLDLDAALLRWVEERVFGAESTAV